MLTVFIIFAFLISFALAGLFILVLKNQKTTDTHFFKNLINELDQKTKEAFADINKTNREIAKEDREEFNKQFSSLKDSLSAELSHSRKEIHSNMSEGRKETKDSAKDLQHTVDSQLKNIRTDNDKQISEMRNTVDEKLQSTLEKRLGESFKQVSQRLEQVHSGLGEMKNIAVGVGDLKRVLSNVKMRGILGEYQLGNILEQILTPNQYSHNVATKKASQANVEYAVKLPGANKEEEVWLPIDSKFPLESYQQLLAAQEQADKEIIINSEKKLLKSIELFAKDISQKYIDPPHTTQFAILFLPVEGLYAEVLRHPGLFEKLQRQYNITVVGPSTLSAFLNSLHMGFRTLVLQKQSSKVWNVLSLVKTEFAKFSSQLAKVNKQLRTASLSLEELEHKRSNAMSRQLQSVEVLELDTEEKLNSSQITLDQPKEN